MQRVNATRIHVRQVDMEKLIQLVRGYPCLYDTSHPDHKDPHKVQHVWDNIAILMGYEDMDGVQWKKKWRNQRDAYVKKKREIVCGKTPMSAHRAKSWPFLAIMSFLDDHVQETSVLTDTSSYEGTLDREYAATHLSDEGQPGADDAEETQSWGSYSGVDDSLLASRDIKVEATEISKSPVVSTLQCSDRKRPKTGRELMDGLPHSKICGDEVASDFMLRVPHLNQQYATRNEADAFFESCALRMQKLPPYIQSYVHLQIAQIFFNAENPHLDAQQIIPLPSHSMPSDSQTMSSQHGGDLSSP